MMTQITFLQFIKLEALVGAYLAPKGCLEKVVGVADVVVAAVVVAVAAVVAVAVAAAVAVVVAVVVVAVAEVAEVGAVVVVAREHLDAFEVFEMIANILLVV